jgi:hypothetical protein
VSGPIDPAVGARLEAAADPDVGSRDARLTAAFFDLPHMTGLLPAARLSATRRDEVPCGGGSGGAE